MKPIQTRENARKHKLTSYHSKDAQSQSPPHKKLLKKIEMTHKETNHKNDMSLKENLLAREPQEEVVVDFRVEIERRFNKAIANHTYRFPRNRQRQDDDDTNGTDLSSRNSSFESLKHVTIYDLSSQNNKRKTTNLKQVFRGAVTDDRHLHKSSSNYIRRDADDDDQSDSWEAEERSGVPIELRIRDKNTATYKKLLHLIDQQLNPSAEIQQQNNVVRAQIAKKQQAIQEQTAKAAVPQQQYPNDALNTVEDEQDVEVHRLDLSKAKKERNIKSQGKERGTYNVADFQRLVKGVTSSGTHGTAKKNLSQDRIGSRIETNQSGGSSTIEKTMSHLNVSTTKG